MSRRNHLGPSTIIAIAIALACIWAWKHDQARRAAAQTLFTLNSALSNPDASLLLDTILIPVAVRDHTLAEQLEFITTALADEISPAGVEALRCHAEFGPIRSIFPDEAMAWCEQVGVNVDDCVAFKMNHAGVRAEVVLVREGQSYRVVRCNNVKQMALATRHA